MSYTIKKNNCPRIPPYLLGVTNLRDNVVPIISNGTLLVTILKTVTEKAQEEGLIYKKWKANQEMYCL